MEFILHNYNKIEFSEPMRNDNKLKGMFPNSWRHWGDENSHIFFKGGEFLTQRMMKVRTVNWMYKEITLWPMGSSDVLSFEFSGCIMAAFQWDGIWHAAHIQMGGEFSRFREWGRFMSEIHLQLTKLIMFRPDHTKKRDVQNRYRIQDEDDIRVVGLITTEKECFTLYLKKLDKTEKNFALLAYKQHNPSLMVNAYESILSDQLVSREQWNIFFDAVYQSDMKWCEQFRRNR